MTATSPSTPRLVLADRGDALVDPLTVAARRRFDVVAHVDAELSSPERLLVGAVTVRPRRAAWVERFHKSNLAVTLRSRRARARLRGAPAADVVLQTHGLFETDDPRTVLYVDCTHRQSMEQWPAWNPLRGRGLRRWLDRETRQLHRAAHVFAFYEETARVIVQVYGVPADRVSVVGAGVGFDPLPAVRRAHGGPPTVLFVGNDFDRKGGRDLLAAFTLVRALVPDARLRLVGTRHRVPRQDGVEQLGRVRDRARLSQLFAEADVFCLPAHFDPFPGALIEAMAHGLPCVVTATCGIPEIVVAGETALCLEPDDHDPPAIAAALVHLLTHPAESEEMGSAGRRRVETQLRWTHVLERMAPVLERLADTDREPVRR